MRAFSEIFQGIEVIICYFDRILSYANIPAAHKTLLNQVYQQLKVAGLKLNNT